MAPNYNATTIAIPLLDRLIDEQPDVELEDPPTRDQAVRTLKRAVLRDLMYLLNTRRISEMPDPSFKELNRSLYVYGLPEISALSKTAATDEARLKALIVEIIGLFEPRLDGIRPVTVDTEKTRKNVLHFRIEAILKMNPVPEAVSFDTVVDTKSGHFILNGGHDA